MSDTNLLEETMSCLNRRGFTPKDVVWVGSRAGDAWTTWDVWAAEAAGINYDSGYGVHHIDLDLVVVGDGWWLERQEYDGSEHWVYKSLPARQTQEPAERVNTLNYDPYNQESGDDW